MRGRPSSSDPLQNSVLERTGRYSSTAARMSIKQPSSSSSSSSPQLVSSVHQEKDQQFVFSAQTVL
jgi:hypothetical protein